MSQEFDTPRANASIGFRDGQARAHAQALGGVGGVRHGRQQLERGAVVEQRHEDLDLGQRALRGVSLLAGDIRIGVGNGGQRGEMGGVGFQLEQAIDQRR